MKGHCSTFFIAPSILNNAHPSRLSGVSDSVHQKCSPFRNRNVTMKHTPGTPGSLGHSGNGDNNFDDGTLGRFSEFSTSGGNSNTQDDLVREVLWQATCQATSESMQSTIQTHLNATSELLSDMYSKSERDIEERNQRLAIKTSLPDISKWNKHLRNGSKTSKQNRMEISKELAIVDALLKRTVRRQQMSKGRRRRTRYSQQTGTTHGDNESKLTDTSTSANLDIISEAMSLSTPKTLMFTAIVSTFVLESFDTVTSQEGGTSRLVNFATFSAFLILMMAYLSSVRIALQKAQEDLNGHSGRYR